MTEFNISVCEFKKTQHLYGLDYRLLSFTAKYQKYLYQLKQYDNMKFGISPSKLLNDSKSSVRACVVSCSWYFEAT